MLKFLRHLILLLVFGVSPVAAAHGQASAPAAAPTPSAEQLQGLLQTLQDPEQRSHLVSQIQALIDVRNAQANPPPAQKQAAQPPGWGNAFVALLADQTRLAGATLGQLVNLTVFSSLLQSADHIATDPATRDLWLRGIAIIVGVVGLALLVRSGTVALLAPVRRRIAAPGIASFWTKAVAFLAGILVGWLPELVFFMTGYALLVVGLAVGGMDGEAHIVTLAILQARALVRMSLIVAAACLGAMAGSTGLLRISDETANYWLIWSGRLVRFATYSYFALGVARYSGLSAVWDAILTKAPGLVFACMLIMLLLQTRTGMAQLIRGREPPLGRSPIRGLRARLAEVWPIVAILYLIGSYAIWAADIPGGFRFLVRASLLSAVVLVAARLSVLGGKSLANRLLTIPADLDRRLPGLQSRVNRYAPLLIETGSALVYVIAALLVSQLWGLDVIVWFATSSGQHLVGSLIVVALTVAVAIVTWEIVGLTIQLYFGRVDADGKPIERGARARTLLPLFRNTLAIVLAALVVLVTLSEIGLNIAPLLAGAGIVGIAVGFGAQSLVKDVITGIFILMQDAVSVGDVVTVAGNSGLVEQISIRSIRLRDLDGTVILVPFSEVSTVRNLTKDYSYALFSVGVSYREDIDEVITVLTALAEELHADPEYQWRILETIEVLGLDQFGDSAVIVKMRIKTRPIQQWTIMREFNRRLKRRFDELGIEMPFPHRTIYFGVDKKGDAPPAHLVTTPNRVARAATCRKHAV